MATRIHFESSNEIGVFAKLTNRYCITAVGGNFGFLQILENEVWVNMPIVATSIGGTRVVGRLICGNK
jgi:translation initiation factor 6